MRSNIARTCGSGSVPVELTPLAERGEVLDELAELLRILLRETAVRRHRRRRVEQRPPDRGRSEPVADLGQLRPRPGVSVVADPVAAKAAGGCRDAPARLQTRRGLELDLRRGAGQRALDRQ